MATGRYTRLDVKKSSSNCCSSVTIVVLVSACLIAAWVLMSSSVDPEGNVGVPVGLGNVGKQERGSESYSREFESDRKDIDESVKIESDEGKEVEAEKDESPKEDERSSAQEDETSTSEKEGSEESSDDREKKTDESEGKSEAEESSDDKKEVEQTESKTDEESEKSVEEKSDGKEMMDETKPQETESKTDEESEKSVEDKSDGKEMMDETKPQDETNIESQEKVDEDESSGSGSKETEKEKKTEKFPLSKDRKVHKWKVCKVTAGPDYIPCLDNIKAIRKLPSTLHYEHRERHCPEEAPTCLVPLPEGYKIPVKWPKSREKIWFSNVPHTKLADVKGHQNWVKVSGEYLTFPGGGTQFTHGALSYIDFIQKTLSDIAWGKRTRVILDVGCGVASFGGYLFERDVLAMSLAPKDEHEAQTQFALERGIPAISAVMGTKRLPFPGMVFDVVHCARCRVPWHLEGGKLLLELNRVLRPGGYFVWSATPVYRKDPENVDIWKAMTKLTKAMCWELVKIGKDKVNDVSAAVYRKPTSNDCYLSRTKNDPPLCDESDDRNAAWGTPLEACIHEVPTDPSERGSQWPSQWPSRVQKAPYWLKDSEVGVNGKAAPKDFTDDYKHWKLIVSNSYLNGIGIDWSSVRNVMDMRATYGGFAAALKDLKVWVMNVVPVNSLDTLPIIYERGLFGIYHDWCESFSTYPRSYDLLHADHLFSNLKKRCNFVAVMAEVDRILRPEGKLVVRDDAETINEVESMVKSLQWKVRFTFSKDNEGLLCVQKTKWRPSEEETIRSAIA